MNNQGSNAKNNGTVFEKEVSGFLKDCGYSLGKLTYKSLDHNKKERPLDVYVDCQNIAVECKHYKAWGSKVQNYCWDIYNAAKCIPCDRYYAVWSFTDTTGKTGKCFNRAVEMAAEMSKSSGKDIQVVTWNEFKSIVDKGFPRHRNSTVRWITKFWRNKNDKRGFGIN